MGKGDSFLREFQQTAQGQLSRLRQAVQGINEAELNHREGDALSIGQILEHLCLSHEPYVERMTLAVENPVKGPCEPVMTKFGAQLTKFAGPDFDAPMPGKFKPKMDRYELGIIVRYANLQEASIALAKKLDGVDLNQTKFRNPVVPLFKMNLVDGFSLMAAHGERHLRQIEARRAK